MTQVSARKAAFDLSNIVQTTLFRFLNTLWSRRPLPTSSIIAAGMSHAEKPSTTHALAVAWRYPWPLTARVPVVSGVLILVVAMALSRLMMSSVVHEQELGVRQIAAVYLDGIATTVYPHVVARNLANTTEALRRSMWFHQGMREQRAIVQLPDGTVFADVFGPNDDVGTDDPLHDAALHRQLEQGGGFVFDARTGTGWASRAIVRDGKYIAELYVAVELKALLNERQELHRKLLMATVLSGLAAAVIGFLIVRRMVLPVRLLTKRLRRAQMGDFARVSPQMLPPASSEYGRLFRDYNDLVDAVSEREALTAKLAQRERESVLGRLAATVAHEVRNPLGGMSTALDTVRKFGADPNIRAAGLDLVERGLWSIGDVVNSVLVFHRMPPDNRQLTAADLRDLQTLIEPELRRRRLRLAWDCDIQGTIDVAATEARQIALNLLMNACEASPPGGEIGFGARLGDGGDSGARPRLVLQVIDDGPGLPEFVRAALTEVGVTDPQDPPRGLGIRVIRDLVRGLGGGIVATTGLGGHGSRIIVTLPLANEVGQEAAR
jgi:signal transduction histidine kinase